MRIRLVMVVLGMIPVVAGEAVAQPKLVAGAPAGGQLPLFWTTTQGRIYRMESSDALVTWSPLAAPQSLVNPVVAPGSSMVLSVPMTGTRGFHRVVETKYVDPAWADVKPLRVISLNYDTSVVSSANGVRLRTAMQALVPGDHLVIGPGTYDITSYISLDQQGTAAAPIWITSGSAGGVIIRHPGVNQNVLNVGGMSARFLALRGLEITGGSRGLNLLNCADVWIDNCHVHHTDDAGVVASTQNCSRLHITRNEVNHIGGFGEGIALGISSGTMAVSESIVAFNHVHDTNGTTVTQGDGIEVKLGSWGNLITGNLVHDCAFPCIIVGPTNGLPANVVENNVAFRSNDAVMMVGAGNVLRNNLAIGGEVSALICQTMNGVAPTGVIIRHNTFINQSRAVRLSNLGAGVIFANNACYSQSAEVINAPTGAGSATITGNVTFGTVAAGFTSTAGTGLGDFVNVTWDGLNRNAAPSATSPLRGAGALAHATEWDVEFHLRTAPTTAGCYR